MGALAGVPIEPPEQTKLLNACVSQAGVIGGGVPGGVPFYYYHYLPRFLNGHHYQLEAMMQSGY